MATYRCIMFGQILFDDKLTWEELHSTEARLTSVMETVITDCGGRHIDFTPLADALLGECVFPEVDRDNNHALCNTLIRQLGPHTLGRLMFVDRQMDSTVFYFLGRGKWQEQALSVPGPKQALSGWVVRQERKNPTGRAASVASGTENKDKSSIAPAPEALSPDSPQNENSLSAPDSFTEDKT